MMLKITNDGRKLALDQRLMNEMLPDEPESKVNRCVDNAFKVWEESASDKGTQLIFCDLSTPKADGTFNVYDDVREKLVAKGVPREEVAFIHEYNTETKKADLFAKVRAGQVRILMGSTPKLGAGTNIQDRLIALHHLDCPWKPSDLEQQEGRILRQGNRNKQVKIYRYVTENTFDSYMWQILENKQKFISQIMTSKSPVRACDDVDDTALSYAEIKALATGNPYIKEKMDLDIQVSKLKLLKANHTSQIYSLESDIARRYPREIAVAQGQIEALKTDMEAAKPLLAQDKDHFSMEIGGKVYTERKEAGAAIIEACKALKAAGTEGRIGSYGAFELHSRFDNFDKVFRLSIKGAWNYSMEVGKDPLGNILRVTNALAGIERALPQVERRLETLEQQLAQAKEEAKRPFAQEAELAEKSARLAELNSLLNMDEKGSEDALGVDEDAAETEVADRPRQPVNYAGRVAERTADNVRKPSVLAQLHAKQAERSAESQNGSRKRRACMAVDRKQQMKEITERLEQGVKDIFTSEMYTTYLRTMAKFHNYSFNNTLLIAMQRPDATLVAGFNAWKNKFNRYVKKGEKGIQIIAPAPIKEVEEREKIDKDTGLAVLNENGEPEMERVEYVIPRFRLTTVFDSLHRHQ